MSTDAAPADHSRPCVSSETFYPAPLPLISFRSAMMGQYPFAAFAGKLIDYYGPSLCSAIAAILYSSAFSLFSYHVNAAASDVPISSLPTILTVSFCLAGVATVFSWAFLLF